MGQWSQHAYTNMITLKTILFCSDYTSGHDLALSWLFRSLEQRERYKFTFLLKYLLCIRCFVSYINYSTVKLRTTTLWGEEFRGRKPSQLEQFTGRSANRNSLTCDFRSTSEGPPIWLIDSASEDYLWRTTQIHYHSSSSSSSCMVMGRCYPF